MAAPLNQVFFPATFQELFSAWSRFPTAVPYAGGTGLIRGQDTQMLDLPPIILSLDKLDELRRINRSERFLEIGSMVTLSQIIHMGKTVPDILISCLENIAGMQLRNIATIGGNICFPLRRLDASAALTALDAQYELRNAQASRWISASRFSSLQGPTALNSQELLTRIRVPRDQWDYSVYKKFATRELWYPVAVFMIKTQKNMLSDIRVLYKTDIILRDKNSETILIGKQLPLNRRIAAEFTAQWESFLSGFHEVDELSKKEMVNFIESNVYNLSE
jgi:CO/xanthine dehydrogenase FAD-binding subunit